PARSCFPSTSRRAAKPRPSAAKCCAGSMCRRNTNVSAGSWRSCASASPSRALATERLNIFLRCCTARSERRWRHDSLSPMRKQGKHPSLTRQAQIAPAKLVLHAYREEKSHVGKIGIVLVLEDVRPRVVPLGAESEDPRAALATGNLQVRVQGDT